MRPLFANYLANFYPICLLSGVQVSKKLEKLPLIIIFCWPRHVRGVFSQNTTLEVMASKTWKKLKFASKFGNKAEIVREKEEEVEEDLLYKIVKEPEPKYKNIIRDYSQIIIFILILDIWNT